MRFDSADFVSNSEKLEEAEANFKKLLAEMTLEAGKVGYNERV